MSTINIQNVSVILGKDFSALNDVTASLSAGKIIGFIRPSGAGKTTLMRAIVGRQRLRKGSITVLGQPAGAAPLRSQVSYMTQEPSVYGDLTVAENIRYFATMMGIPRRHLTEQVQSILKTVDMAKQSGQLVEKLSGGQRQRVSLAIALIGTPKVMVLDEPTVGLDPVLREELWRLFRTLAAQNITLLISSHVMDEAERCDELLLIRDGKLLAQGSPEALCKQTQTASVEQSFLKLVGAKS